MYVQYQLFQLGGRAEEVEVVTNPETGKQYVLLQDVQDVFPAAARFARDGRPVRFQSDEHGNRLEPWRIAHYPETILQVIQTRQVPLPSSATWESSGGSSSQTCYCCTPASAVLSAQGSGEDRRDYLAQRGVRAVILAGASVLNVQVRHLVSTRRTESFSRYWDAAGLGLFLLNLVWFRMLAILAIQVVWFLVSTPRATKSTYQRLFDF